MILYMCGRYKQRQRHAGYESHWNLGLNDQYK